MSQSGILMDDSFSVVFFVVVRCETPCRVHCDLFMHLLLLFVIVIRHWITGRTEPLSCAPLFWDSNWLFFVVFLAFLCTRENLLLSKST